METHTHTAQLAHYHTHYSNIKLRGVHFIVGRGVMPSVKLALDHVNEHSDILSNYRLHMWWNDTQVNMVFLLFIFGAFSLLFDFFH